ncbi:hypothetical protein [Aminicella lysinilytica]|uniref:Uncharacterized protein n=1 Tax=Aminicella lysinilytica TaxID=433323 RepID=A0A4R6PZU1_9FIRM|nr:hypothetical protein [Aminicella lysinilytica]TDP51402.1 hypothetical protein EV211_13123 [Aminicella lysinilytica]
MIMRRVIGLVILAAIIIVGTILYFVLKKKVSYVESDLTIRKKEDIKGK